MDGRTAGKGAGRNRIGAAVFAACAVLAAVLICMVMKDGGKSKDGESEPASRTGFVLNTVVTITIEEPNEKAEEYLGQCFALCDRYEKICSRTDSESELYAINEQVKKGRLEFEISDELADIISCGLSYGEVSDGGFDITIEPVSAQWDFTSDTRKVPEDGEIMEALSGVCYRDVTLKGNTLKFAGEGMGLDLGGIAKGYIADRIKEYLLENGVESAIISLGGNILCVGEKPNGDEFHIGIQMPFGEYQETVAAVACKDISIVTSGIYERYFVEDDVLYHHILNPKTGYPYENNLLGVTVLSKKSVDGDGLSTACFALGPEEGMKLIDSLEDTYAVFITADKKLHYSEGFKDYIIKD